MNRWIDTWRKYIAEIKSGERKLPKDGMLIMFLCGILIFVILLPTGNSGNFFKTKEETGTVNEEPEVTAQIQTRDSGDYQKELEQQLEDFLCEIEGVGEVKVLLYMDASQQYVVEKDVPTRTSTTTTVSSGGQEDNKEEQREEETVYTVNGNGEQVPFITQTINPKITGVAIAAQGAQQESIKMQIVRLAMALYGLEANKVEVFVLKNVEK